MNIVASLLHHQAVQASKHAMAPMSGSWYAQLKTRSPFIRKPNSPERKPSRKETTDSSKYCPTMGQMIFVFTAHQNRITYENLMHHHKKIVWNHPCNCHQLSKDVKGSHTENLQSSMYKTCAGPKAARSLDAFSGATSCMKQQWWWWPL